MNKDNFWKIIIAPVILIGLLAGGWFFIRNKPTKENEKNNQTQNQETEKWEIYRNEKYGFEIKYPAEWQVYAPDNSYGPIINVYKTGNPPFIHRSNVTQVSIFPEGLGTEGPVGESEKLTADLTLAEENMVNQFILSNNKKPFGYLINLKNIPQNWEYGFIWGSVEVKNWTIVCRDEAKDRNTCEPFVDGLNVTGEVDEQELNTVKEILYTFKFTKQNQ